MKNLKNTKRLYQRRSILISSLLGCLFILIIGCSSKEDNIASAKFDITELSVTNLNGTTPKKGETLKIQLTIKNTSGNSNEATIIPLVSSSRFSDFKDVKLKKTVHFVPAGETKKIFIEVGPFIFDESTGKHFAFGRGEYYISSVMINEKIEKDFLEKVFNIESSNAILVPVLVDPGYLKKLVWRNGIKAYLENAFTRKVELYDNGTYTEYPNGLDEMMDIKHIFYPIETQNVLDHSQEGGKCEKAIALAKEELGLLSDWKGPVGTNTANHGFDYLMALSRDSFGGVACGWINVQVTGVFDFDLSLERSQILLIHETSHLLGAPHCDPLQSYVMCAGEKHKKYIDEGTYVYNIASKNQMSNRFD